MRAIKSRVPEVIVSDIGMPGVDGYEFMRRVRRLKSNRGEPLSAIALTAFVRPEDRQRAIEAGFQAHLSKPLHPQELAATLANLLNRD